MSLFQIVKATQNLLDFRSNCFQFFNLAMFNHILANQTII